MVLTIRSVAKSLRSVHPRFMETVTLTSALFNSRQDFLSRCERDFSCLRSDRNLSYKERLTSGIAGIKKDDAVHLFHSMLRSRPLPTVIDFNKLFKAVAKTKQHSPRVIPLQADGIQWSLHSQHNQELLLPPPETRFSLDDAWDLFSSLLPLKGVKPDVKTYNIMIGGLCKKGSLSEADMLFKKMGEEDGTAPSECSGVATSVELIEEMKRCGFAADASTMKMVIDMLSDVTMAAASVSTRFLVLLQDFSAFRKISSWRSAATNYHRQSRLLCHVAKGDGSLTLASLELGNNSPRRSGKSKATKLEGSFVPEMSQGKVRAATNYKVKVVKEKKPAEIVSPLFSAKSFEELGLPDSLLDSLEREGFSVPTDVQSAAVPAIIKGHDAVIQSYTGSGKTLAYLLPILSEIGPLSGKAKSSEKRAEIQAMIVAPSRELGMQIVREVEKLLGPDHRRMVQQLVGGANRMRQEEALKKNKPAIVVGTPGRIAEISKSGRLHTHGCRFLVLDEVDELLSFNFREDIHRIIEHVGRRAGAGPKGEVDERANRQTILVSATVPFSVIRAAKSWSHEPVLVQANKTTPLDTVQPTAPAISLTPTTSEANGQIQTTIQSLPPALKHFYCISKHQHKVDALRRCVHALDAQSVIAFMNHSKQLKDVVYKLEARGMTCAELHGDLGKLGRSTVLKKFKNGEVRVLVTNELSARGLDVAECDLVVNLELPTDAVHYAHRAGRTGRLGRKGTVVTVCEESQVFIVKKMEKQLGLPFEYCEFVDGELVVTEEDKAIISLFNEMEAKGIEANVVTYNSLISSFCKAGRWDDGAQLLKDMITRGIASDVVIFNALIDCLVKERKLKEAEELHCKVKRVDDGMKLFREISLRGLVADTITYSILIQGFCQEGKLNVAKELFQEMVSEGARPDTVTYGILLDGLCDNGELEEALEILDKMHTSKMDPGIGVYNIIIHGMCNARKVDDAWDLFSSLLPLKGVKADVKTYTIMIAGLCKKGSLSEADMLFKKMGEEDGIAPNECTYNTLIRAHLGGSGVVASVELIEEMKRCGFAADGSTMKMVIDMLSDGRLNKSFWSMLS
ncbi:hypothetical protein HID58_081095 [Brassica napus]|uniref:RNA helicase n=2 Tax=Brassica TaxID=3705 RepID=A0ABQ7Y6S6_BRANA|nr:hypothetical protein HID58_081095 [Brassica napus]